MQCGEACFCAQYYSEESSGGQRKNTQLNCNGFDKEDLRILAPKTYGSFCTRAHAGCLRHKNRSAPRNTQASVSHSTSRLEKRCDLTTTCRHRRGPVKSSDRK